MGLTKQQLEALNNSSFPNNNSGYITPAILRNYNSESVANTVNQDAYSTDSASVDSRLDSLEAFSASLDATFATDAQLNASSSTLQANINTKLDTASYQTDSASFSSRIDNVTFDTSSLTSTASFNAYTASNDSKVNSLISVTSSYATTGSNTFVGNQTINGDLQISGSNFLRFGSDDAIHTATGVFTIESQGGMDIRQLAGGAADITIINSQGDIDLSGSTGTKIQNVDFIPFSSSLNNRINNITINTSSLATTGSNVFVGNQTISGSLVLTGDITASKLLVQIETASIIYSSGSNQLGDSLSDVQTLSGSVKVNGTFETTGSISSTGDITLAGKLLVDNTASLQFPLEVQDGGIKHTSTNTGWIIYNEQSNGGLYRYDTATLALQAQSASLWVRNDNGQVYISGAVVKLNDVDFIDFSSSVDSRLDTIPSTGSFATTGSNTFKGQQIVSSSVLIVTSGSGDIESLKLLPYLSSSTYNGYRDLTTVARDRTVQFSVGGASNIYSASAVNPVNIIFGQTIPTATAQGTISGSNNILLTTRLNSSTGSEGFSANFAYITTWPIINNPFLGNTVRSTNSFINSTITINLQNNGISASTALGYPNFNRADAVTINNTGINGTTVVTPSGSAITLQSNLLYGGPHTFISPRVDSWTGAEYALNSSSVLGVTNNIFQGQVTVTDRNSVRAGGNNTNVQNNLFGGVAIEVVTPVSGTNSTGHVFNTIAYGNGLIVTGSMASQGGGSGVFGRFNANDGIRNALQQNVFIVGTGTSNSIRKTGFLIDSGSNVYVEGSLNVSGSTALTGSLIHSGSLSITGSGGIILTGSLQLTGSNLVINSAGTLIYNDKTVIQFYPSINSNTESYSRFTKDGINIFQYQNQGHVFGFRYTADQLNEYSGSQFKTALTNDGTAYDDYVSYISASISGSGGSIPGIQLTDGKAIYQNKPLLQKQRAYFDQDVIIAGQGVATSLTVTGSTNFSELGNISLGNYSSSVGTHISTLATTGSNTFNGNQIISGSVTIANTNGNDLYVHGHKQFNAGEFWSTITQSGSAGVSGSITFNTSGSVYGVSIVSSSQVTMANAGVYNIQFSAQIETSAGSDTAYIWFKKNGSNIADSATKVVLANNTSQVMTVNILDTAAANDYYELCYQFTNGNATILAEAASGNIPAIPSVILTVTQVR